MNEDIECELDRLMSMFAEPEPEPLTQAEIDDLKRLERIRNANSKRV